MTRHTQINARTHTRAHTHAHTYTQTRTHTHTRSILNVRGVDEAQDQKYRTQFTDVARAHTPSPHQHGHTRVGKMCPMPETAEVREVTLTEKVCA